MDSEKKKEPEDFRLLANRLRYCAGIAGSGDNLSRKTAIPRRTLESYLTGESEPKVSRLLDIATTANVDIGWLASGQGLPHPDHTGLHESTQGQENSNAFGFPASFQKTKDTVSKEAVSQSIQAIKSYLDEKQEDMPAEDFAQTVLTIAELAPKYGKIDLELVKCLMKFKGDN